MIQLHPDYLLFQLPDGQAVPCSAETITIELIGEAAAQLDPEVIKNAAAAVLHYFTHDQGRQCVSVGEFSLALERVLRGFGYEVVSGDAPEGAAPPAVPGPVAALDELADTAGRGGELLFFHELRAEVRRQLGAQPGRLCFSGLRPCVKSLLGARRWTSRCQGMSDAIVNFVRDCARLEPRERGCAILIR